MTDLETLLIKTSRTFALSIAFLPKDLRRQVTIAYLLFRIADTLEDADQWTTDARAQALHDLAAVIRTPDGTTADALAARWSEPPPVTHAGYLELLSQTRFVLETFEALPAAPREVIREHLLRTISGMAAFLEKASDGVVRVDSLEQLRRYCHVVAGIVGEMLTELFLLEEPVLVPVGPYLRERANRFGEALQLVNILKDQEVDAREGRLYLPAGVRVAEVIALARRSLDAAEEYTVALERGGARQVLVFNQLLVRLASASLARVEERGPGAKLSRLEVMAIVAGVQGQASASDEMVAGVEAANPGD